MTAYHVILRRIGGSGQLAEWHGGEPWSYPQAREFLLTVERQYPHLHEPHAGCYLVAEPLRESFRPLARDDSWGEWPS